ncbi:MAG: ABC transporter ATP-binding protein [Candidatus Limivicinus sp.]
MGGCLKGCVPATILSPVTISLEALLEVFIPILMATIVDGGLYRAEEFKLKPFFSAALIADRNRFVITVGCIMILAALCSFAFGCLSARFSAVASMGFAANLRAKLLKKIQSFSFANTDRFTPASLVMRCTSDVNSMQSSFQELIRNMVRAPMMMIFAIIMSFSIDSQLAWIFVVCLPVLFVTIALIVSTGRRRFKLVLGRYDDLNARVREGLIAQREVKAFVREDFEKERFTKTNHQLRIAQVNSEKIFMLSGPIQMLTMWLCTVVILYVGGSNIIFGRTSLQAGELISIVTYTGQVINALSMVSFMVLNLARTAESLKRINEVLDEETDIRDGEGDFPVADGSVRFENVSFSYTGDPNNLALEHIDLDIASGETVGVIGGTGEGKSTLVSLIPRFYDPIAGRVLVGGRDVKDYRLHALRQGVSMVLQNGSLFSGTIAENLRWSDENASDGELRAACAAACADEFIDKMPQGYDTVLGQGGVNLSGGQKQRLRIARALLKKPKILILDDCTSAVDNATDIRIRAALRHALPGATKIIIAQRIASVMDADRIVVLSHGCVADVGSHDELMERCSIYRDIYDSQQKGREEKAGEAYAR